MAPSDTETIWIGTKEDTTGLWDGRIDELALDDQALTYDDVDALYQAVQDKTLEPN